MRHAALVLLAVLVAPPVHAFVDQPITGAKLQLKRSSSGKEKLVFQSKDPSLPFTGDVVDPRITGATIEVISLGVTPQPFAVPQNDSQPGWTLKVGAVPTFKYRRDKTVAATTSIKQIVIKEGRGISLLGDATGIPLDGARGLVAIRVTIGEYRSCARFTGASVTKDVAGTFAGKNATTDGLLDCDVSSLTGLPPTCGDGDVNQPSEGCDATCPNDYGEQTCRPPGTSNECTCCWDGGPSDAVPCCNPSSKVIIYPPSYEVCIATRCDPPDSCADGDECQADHSCCSVVGGRPCVQAYAPPYSYMMVPLNACCPGLQCGRVDPPAGGAFCCGAAGTSCSGDADCCSAHCQIDGTCEACRTAGAGCGSNQECCSGSCSGGVCPACAGAGVFCASGATCCSGTCTNFQCQ